MSSLVAGTRKSRILATKHNRPNKRSRGQHEQQGRFPRRKIHCSFHFCQRRASFGCPQSSYAQQLSAGKQKDAAQVSPCRGLGADRHQHVEPKNASSGRRLSRSRNRLTRQASLFRRRDRPDPQSDGADRSQRRSLLARPAAWRRTSDHIHREFQRWVQQDDDGNSSGPTLCPQRVSRPGRRHGSASQPNDYVRIPPRNRVCRKRHGIRRPEI